MPDVDEYEVRIYDAERGRTLVAAIEIVSPANKDRPENRNAFVGKCMVTHTEPGPTTADPSSVANRHSGGFWGDILNGVGVSL